MDLKNRIPCAIMNQGKSMLIDKTSILSQNLGHYQDTLLFFGVCAQLAASRSEESMLLCFRQKDGMECEGREYWEE